MEFGETSVVNSLPEQSIEQIWDRPWPWSIWLSIVIVLSVGLAVVALYWTERGKASAVRRSALAGLRIGLLLLVWWMLAGWNVQRFKNDLPELVMLIDDSSSMQTADIAPVLGIKSTNKSDDRWTRWQTATGLLNKLWKDEGGAAVLRYRPKLYVLSAEARQIATEPSELADTLSQLEPNGDQSRLGDGLIQILQRQSGRPTAAILLLSDGIVTSGISLEEAAEQARRLAIPVICVATGEQLPQPDLGLVDLLADDAVYLGDRVNVQVSVTASDIAAHRATVNLRDMQSGQIVDSAQVEISMASNTTNVQLSYVPTLAGNSMVKLEVTAAPNEKNLENNSLERVIEVRDQTLRILMIQKAPSYEFRFLKTLLERTSQMGESGRRAFDLDVVLQDADAAHVAQDASSLRLVPGDNQTIAGYDVIVLGEIDPSLIANSTQQLIVQHVTTAGCGFIFVCHPGFNPSQLAGWPLASLLPLDPSGPAVPEWYDEGSPRRWQPTVLGRSALPFQLTDVSGAGQIWRALPGPHWHFGSGPLKPGAQVLATAWAVDTSSETEVPLLISQFAGAGRVVFQANDETHLWVSFRGSDLTYQRYWIQMLRWLARGKLNRQNQSELVVEPRQARLGEPIQFHVHLSPEDSLKLAANECSVAVEKIGGESRTVGLLKTQMASTQYKASDASLPAGSYRASILRPADALSGSVTFTITAPPGEKANLRSDWTAMRNLAEQTHGQFLTASEAQPLLAKLPKGSPVRRGALPPLPLWNSVWIATAFIVMIALEWILRRSSQML